MYSKYPMSLTRALTMSWDSRYLYEWTSGLYIVIILNILIFKFFKLLFSFNDKTEALTHVFVSFNKC